MPTSRPVSALPAAATATSSDVATERLAAAPRGRTGRRRLASTVAAGGATLAYVTPALRAVPVARAQVVGSPPPVPPPGPVLVFGAALSGAAEVPARATPASGTAAVTFNAALTQLAFQVAANAITNLVAGHIHLGGPTDTGPVVVGLLSVAPPGANGSGLTYTGTATAADLVGPLAGQPLGALHAAMLAGQTYVNLHTNDFVAPADTGPGDFPGGEIRGQIAPS